MSEPIVIGKDAMKQIRGAQKHHVELLERLGRCDVAVAEAEANRDAARSTVRHAALRLNELIERELAKVGLQGKPCKVDLETGAVT